MPLAVLQKVCKTIQVHSALHPSGMLNRVPASAGAKDRKVIAVGWQVILCDPIWHVTSRSGEVIHMKLVSSLVFTYLFTELSGDNVMLSKV